MADREITSTIKNKNGDIAGLCNSSELWSPKLKSMAIYEIEDHIHRYYIIIGNEIVYIHVVNDPFKGKYLRTDPDKTTKNNLLELPDC